MDWQNLGYALVQLVHNFGAVSVSGGALAALWPASAPVPVRRRLAWLVLAGWAVQGASGAGFGAISYAWYGQLPDIHGIAVAALVLKMACAAAGFALAATYLGRERGWHETRRHKAWMGLFALAAGALGAAAFLRWFS